MGKGEREGRARATFFQLFFVVGAAEHERVFYFLRRARGLYQTAGVRVCVCVGAADKSSWLVFLVECKGSRDGEAEGATLTGGAEAGAGEVVKRHIWRSSGDMAGISSRHVVCTAERDL